MTDAQAALAQVREALAAGPTPGPWVTMPANAGVHCVARINAWEAVPPSDCELSHDSIDASFIAACSPANMTAILAHVEAQAAEIERLTAELETERMRLTACGVAALANTADSAARARDIRPEYRSASLDDVERAVDREIQLRDERDELRRQLAEAEMDAERGIGG